VFERFNFVIQESTGLQLLLFSIYLVWPVWSSIPLEAVPVVMAGWTLAIRKIQADNLNNRTEKEKK
jgi:hypothetical protein